MNQIQDYTVEPTPTYTEMEIQTPKLIDVGIQEKTEDLICVK